MGSSRYNEHSQRALTGLLRVAIDQAERDGRAWRTVDALIAGSTHAALSTHVLYNIGARRAAIVVARATPSLTPNARSEMTRYDLPLGRDASLVGHTPRPPFIRVTDWTKGEGGRWKVGRAYCSLCRLQVALIVDTDGGPGQWTHVSGGRRLPR